MPGAATFTVKMDTALLNYAKLLREPYVLYLNGVPFRLIGMRESHDSVTYVCELELEQIYDEHQ